ncbi:MAG: ATP-binding cassette domain-containing protein [Eubacteriales bacterium]|nr:ATP-binding cassette domain-containing protein [Eubacteriales bacterium]
MQEMKQTQNADQADEILVAEDICKYFKAGKKQTVKAVDHVNIRMKRGETLGLVGESGCGKTTCGRTLMRLYDPTSGKIYFEGRDISKLKGKELLSFKKDVQIIFQDPYASLDPRMTIGEIISEGMDVHLKNLSAKEKEARVMELLAKVGLNAEYANRFAHELSGGQRQRVGIARALAVEPKFIVCDEPISALDVSIQAQVVNLLMKLQREMGLTYLFISHDLSMVKHISDRVGVMYLGSMAELADSEDLYGKPMHPYTQALISAIPEADADTENTKDRIKLEGEVPSPLNPPSGCKFRTRCRFATERCAQEAPKLRELRPNHFVACHLYDDNGKLQGELKAE